MILTCILTGCDNGKASSKGGNENDKYGYHKDEFTCEITGDITKKIHVTGSDAANTLAAPQETNTNILRFGMTSGADGWGISSGYFNLEIDKLGIPADGHLGLLPGKIEIETSPDNYTTYSNFWYQAMFDDDFAKEGHYNSFSTMTITERKYYDGGGVLNQWHNYKGTFTFMAAALPLGEDEVEFPNKIARMLSEGMTRTQISAALGIKKVSCSGSFSVWVVTSPE